MSNNHLCISSPAVVLEASVSCVKLA